MAFWSQRRSTRVVDSVPSSPSVASSELSSITQSSYDEEYEKQLAQEWEEGVEQLKLIFSVVLLPFAGKWLGKKWAYSLYTRYSSVGLGRAFFFL